MKDVFRKIKFSILLVVVLVSGRLEAQFGNEWIDYSAQYWTFKCPEDGILFLDYDQLQAAGFPVAGINPEEIRFFGRGRELPLILNDGGDGSLDPGDYLSLIVRKNDGWLDEEVYTSPVLRVNPYYSLFNDTASYYISPGNGAVGERLPFFTSAGYNDYAPELFAVRHTYISYSEEYMAGAQDAYGISLPYYEAAEGWYQQRFPKGGSRSADIPTPSAYQGGGAPAALVTAVSAGSSMAAGAFNHHLQVGFGNPFQLAVDTIYAGYQLNRLTFEIPASGVGATTRITHRSIDDLGVATDFHNVSHIAINYAHNLNMAGQSGLIEFTVNGNGDFTRLDFSNISANDPRLFLLDETGFASAEIELIANGNTRHAVIPLSNGSARILLVASNLNTPVLDLVPVSGSAQFTDYTEMLADSAFIIISHPLLWPAAQNYGFYRQLEGCNVLLADITQLYHQYACGIFQHPLAIRRFAHHMHEAAQLPPKALFLLGKSIRSPTISNTAGSRKSDVAYAGNLVPSWGYPASDLALTSGLGNTLYEPLIPTGRIAATGSDQALEYLNKVIEYENQAPAEWQKRILHFGGGGNAFEQGLFANYLSSYETIAEDTCFGGTVYTFLKNTSDPIQISLSDSITTLINEGVSLMTFFGHATSSGFDQNIDHPANYNNFEKYPLLLGNSCYTGNVHLPTSTSTSEIFVLEPNRGTIGFIAKGDLGIPGYLDAYTSSFYKQICQLSYGKPLAECMQNTIRLLQNNNANLYLKNTLLTFQLHGDPLIRMPSYDKPDFSVDAARLFFEPAEVQAETDTIVVKVVVTNIGKATNDPVGIELIRHYPDGSDSSIVRVLPYLHFQDTVRFKWPVDRGKGIGLNSFDLLVDYPADLIPELDDSGNNVVLGKNLLITTGSLIPVYPPPFAVIPSGNTALFASTGNALQAEKEYRIEADTSAGFNSPFLQSWQLSQSGGVVSVEPELSLPDSSVIWWRCAEVPAPGEPYEWNLSSFQIIAGKTGWGQSVPEQFAYDSYHALQQNPDDGSPEFLSTQVSLHCRLYGNSNTSFESLDTHYRIDLDIQDYSGCGAAPAIHVAVIDPITLQPWETNYMGMHPEYDFGNLMTCTESRGRPEKYFIFRQNDASQMQGLQNMLTNEIPDGHYLLVYSWKFATYTFWDQYAPGLADVFSGLGAPEIGTSQDSVPFVFFVQKGLPESAIIQYGDFIDEVIDMQAYMTGTLGAGRLTGTKTSASLNWNEVNWHPVSLPEDSDRLEFQVSGYSPLGQKTALVSAEAEDAVINLDGIPSNQYPEIQLQAFFTDTLNLSAPPLDRWHIMYDPAPECALDPNFSYYLSGDTVKEGELLALSVAIRNISPVDMDSLLVHYWAETPSGTRHYVSYPRQDSLRAGEVLIDTVYVPTAGLSGDNLMWVEANPFISGQGYDQPELSHFNNIARFGFHVISDNINPVLEVSFDGRHILDGELVASKPFIFISLRDENPYFIMDSEADTSYFKLFLTDPEGIQSPVYFRNALQPDLVQWNPANALNRKFSIEFRPELTIDGTYELLVQASDKSGNPSGKSDYRIRFEVNNKPAISHVLNYPNPFSTRTQFVFTLSGAEPPDEMEIRIMTITGKVVRQIRSEELGVLRIGRNQTDFWWDGTDEFGDPLANGIYLYTVTAKLQGQTLDIMETSASSYFSKGVGKMYLMR